MLFNEIIALKTYQIRYLSLLLILLITSCSKDEENLTEFVPQYIKETIPYSQNQKLQFIGSNNDTINCTVNIDIEYFETSSCSGCELTKSEVIYYYVVDDKHNNLAPLAHFETSKRLSDANTILMGINSPDDYSGGPGWSFLLKDMSSDFQCNTEQICHSKLTFNGIEYQNVVEFPWDVQLSYNNINKMYYSKSKGIIQFIYKDSSFYTLATP